MHYLTLSVGGTLAMAGWLWTAAEVQTAPPPRQVLSLDGRWQVAEGAKDQRPVRFDRTVPVPGVLDMAKPGFSEVERKSTRREAFWYRRTFLLPGPVPEAAWLKVHKASYGTDVGLLERNSASRCPANRQRGPDQ